MYFIYNLVPKSISLFLNIIRNRLQPYFVLKLYSWGDATLIIWTEIMHAKRAQCNNRHVIYDYWNEIYNNWSKTKCNEEVKLNAMKWPTWDEMQCGNLSHNKLLTYSLRGSVQNVVWQGIFAKRSKIFERNAILAYIFLLLFVFYFSNFLSRIKLISVWNMVKNNFFFLFFIFLSNNFFMKYVKEHISF